MKFALDTNVISYAIRGEGNVRAQLAATIASDVGIPSLCVFEVLRGAYSRKVGPAKFRQFSAFFRSYETLALDFLSADHAAQIEFDLAATGAPIGRMDALIAGTARAHGLTFVTHNLSEFSRVPGLAVIDWY